MPGIKRPLTVASQLRKDRYRYHRPVLVGDGMVELYAPVTHFRQPKEKLPKHKLSMHETQRREWKARKRRRTERNIPKPTPGCRSTIERKAIEEELFHARELQDLEACLTDGFDFESDYEGSTYSTWTYDPKPKEAAMSIMQTNGTQVPQSAIANPGSTVVVRTGGSRAPKPWRDDCRIQPELTITPPPQGRSREDARLLAKRPINPTTRRAEPVLPEGVWSLDDLIEDRKMVRLGC